MVNRPDVQSTISHVRSIVHGGAVVEHHHRGDDDDIACPVWVRCLLWFCRCEEFLDVRLRNKQVPHVPAVDVVEE